jgi:hypothetical protein
MGSNPPFKPHPESAQGDFNVIYNECHSCGMPQEVAPNLITQNSGDVAGAMGAKGGVRVRARKGPDRAAKR